MSHPLEPRRPEGVCTYCGTRAPSRPRCHIIQYGGARYNRVDRCYEGQVGVSGAVKRARHLDESALSSGQKTSRSPVCTLLTIAVLAETCDKVNDKDPESSVL